MKVKSIAECSLGVFCNTFDLHLAIIDLDNQFLVFFLSGHLRQVLLYIKNYFEIISIFCHHVHNVLFLQLLTYVEMDMECY